MRKKFGVIVKRYKAGIIGCGFGEQHIKWLKQCEQCDVEWIAYHSNRERATAIADRYHIPSVTDQPERLIPEIDFVVIVTPVFTHFPYASQAILQRKMVVCDKPLALDSKEAAELVEMVRKYKTPNMIFFQMRFNKYFRMVKEIVDARLLGKIHFAHCEFYHDFILGSVQPTWRHDPSKSGCGAFADMGVHLIDCLQWLFQDQMEVQFVNKKTTDKTKESKTEDYGTVCFRMVGKEIDGAFSISRTVKGFQFIRMVVSGAEGTIVLELNPSTNEGKIHSYGCSIPENTGVNYEENPYWHWFAHLENGGEIPTFEDGLKAQRVMDQIVQYER